MLTSFPGEALMDFFLHNTVFEFYTSLKEQMLPSTYPGFNYKADELRKFLACTDIFTILLKNGDIIHYTPKDRYAFHQWLTHNNIENIKTDL